jgi:hypothetical protein
MTPRSCRGNEYVFVTVYRGYIHAQPMPSRTAVQYVAAHTRMLNYFNNIGVKFTHMTIDNEKSEDLDTLFKLHDLTVQFQPPGNHRSNFAERAIRTYKNHFIAILSGVHTHFPLDLWDLLLDYASMTLNHLLPYKTDPTISAYHGIHGSPVDFRAHPLHPPRTTCCYPRAVSGPALVGPTWPPGILPLTIPHSLSLSYHTRS